MKIIRFLLGSLCAAFIMGVLVTVAMIVNQTIVDALSNDSVSVSALLRRVKFQQRVIVGGLHTEEHELHKGYASIELIAYFVGLEEIPSPERGQEHWTNSAFYAELRRVFPQYQIIRHSNLRNTELIDVIHDALAVRNPVVVFHAAEVHALESGEYAEVTERTFEKRYSVVSNMDLPRDTITLNDPHGFFHHLTLSDFIRAVRFEDYEKSFFDILTFAFRRYQKNTVFIVERTPPLTEESGEYEQIEQVEQAEQEE